MCNINQMIWKCSQWIKTCEWCNIFKSPYTKAEEWRWMAAMYLRDADWEWRPCGNRWRRDRKWTQCFQSGATPLRLTRSQLRVQHSPPEGRHARRPSSRGPWDSLHAECWCPPQSLEETLRVVGALRQSNTSQQWKCRNVKWRAAELHRSHRSGWRSRTRPEPPQAWLGPRRRSSWTATSQQDLLS